MNAHWQLQMRNLMTSHPEVLRDIGRGIERECLRVTPDGTLATTPHPAALGSALTHTSITTDYSEALLEFITPVSRDIEDTLNILEDIHSFVYLKNGDDLLWGSSMPCIVDGDAAIPVAHYGNSNVGRMKTVYRYGLGHRYGRLMQAIAGIHYNFSMPQSYWENAHAADGGEGSLQDYITCRYLGLIRNFRRWSWLLIYLFGASPAVCASFMRGRSDHPLEPFDKEGKSLHLPHATSLRMGGLGYNSDAQSSLRVCYNSLDKYIATLTEAIRTPHPEYAALNGKENDEYRQLNDGLLQIENEFYSAIRPKHPAQSGEAPLMALRQRGIEYVEVRCIDISPFHPLGIDAPQLRFVDSFLLHCLLTPSPACDEDDQDRQAANLEAVVNRGREPGLQLAGDDGDCSLQDWANTLLDAVVDSATLLDQAHDSGDYAAALALQRAKVFDPETTPSAQVLNEMREDDLHFFHLSLRYSKRWAQRFRERSLSPEALRRLEDESVASIAAQRDIEEADTISFEEYLKVYFAQYETLQKDN